MGDPFLIKRIILGDVDYILDNVRKPSERRYVIATAIIYGCIEIVKAFSDLLPRSHKNEEIVLAAEFGHLDILTFLAGLPGTDAHARDDYALYCAAAQGHLDIVRFLKDKATIFLPALNAAVQNGRLEVVKELLPYVKPTGLTFRLSMGSNEILRALLYTYPRDTTDYLRLAASANNEEGLQILVPYANFPDEIEHHEEYIHILQGEPRSKHFRPMVVPCPLPEDMIWEIYEYAYGKAT